MKLANSNRHSGGIANFNGRITIASWDPVKSEAMIGLYVFFVVISRYCKLTRPLQVQRSHATSHVRFGL